MRSNIYYCYYVQCSIPSAVGSHKRIQQGFFSENWDQFTWKVNYQ